MSITNGQVIKDALRDINVISEAEINSLPAEMGKESLRRLNQVMESWKENDVDVGYFAQTDTTATCPIPEWAELAVTGALMISLASKYGATVSQEALAVADSAISMVQRKVLVEKIEGADMSFMPSGHGRFRYDITTS